LLSQGQQAVEQSSQKNFERLGLVLLLRGQVAEALPFFVRALAKTNDPYDALMVALLADELGDATSRDEALTVATRRSRSRSNPRYGVREELIKLAGVFRDCLAKDTTRPLSTEAMEAMIAAADPFERVNLLYFAGRFLELRGEGEASLTLLRRAARDRKQLAWAAVLARDRLRALGHTPDVVKPGVFMADQ
jgi:hypothetical protein